MLGEGAPAADIAAARHAYGLDVPLGTQYLNYWRGLVHGDMGKSLRYNKNVAQIIGQAYPWTLQLTVAALSVALLMLDAAITPPDTCGPCEGLSEGVVELIAP